MNNESELAVGTLEIYIKMVYLFMYEYGNYRHLNTFIVRIYSTERNSSIVFNILDIFYFFLSFRIGERMENSNVTSVSMYGCFISIFLKKKETTLKYPQFEFVLLFYAIRHFNDKIVYLFFLFPTKFLLLTTSSDIEKTTM